MKKLISLSLLLFTFAFIGGIHFRFDNVAGQSIGRSVANYVFQNLMRPRGCVR